MNKDWKNMLIFTGVLFIIVWLIIAPSENSNEKDSNLNYNENPIEESQVSRNINLLFYDKKTNCTLDGEIYVDDLLLGKTENGVFVLNEEDYIHKFKGNSTLSILGLTDFCFGNNLNLPFVQYWEEINLQYLFDYKENASFEALLNPRSPRYPLEMQRFIKPNEVNLEPLHLEENYSSDKKVVEEVFSRFYMSYASDSALFGKDDYWQTPQDLMKNKAGDCEDWAITMVSMIEAYNPSIDCYLALWDTHMNMICNFKNESFGMFDQDKIKTFTSIDKNPNNERIITQENTVSVRNWLGDYFDIYGLSPNDRKLYYLINSKEIIVFEEKGDFVSWVVEKEKIL